MSHAPQPGHRLVETAALLVSARPRCVAGAVASSPQHALRCWSRSSESPRAPGVSFSGSETAAARQKLSSPTQPRLRLPLHPLQPLRRARWTEPLATPALAQARRPSHWQAAGGCSGRRLGRRARAVHTRAPDGDTDTSSGSPWITPQCSRRRLAQWPGGCRPWPLPVCNFNESGGGRHRPGRCQRADPKRRTGRLNARHSLQGPHAASPAARRGGGGTATAMV